ncbi:MAG: DUF1015 family protein [Bacteroidetes bacterium]|nr:MAG: SpoOJ/ParA/ParB/repB family protein [Bacteroidetes bacterium OLB10]MCE7954484.1 DUF1015 domain-containing protein [Bacteroidetes bacterium CHB6]MCO5288656.1 DUF1015 family protein [Bacteroidota bacterium]
MAILKPFKGIRPKKELVKSIACRPYDVLDEKEARIETKGDPNSFYHVIKPEIDFPDDFDHYSPEIYKKGKENFERMFREGVFFQDGKDCYYIYAQTMDGRKQYGIVGCAAVDDYINGVIKKHELTRPDKEEDRKNHVRVSGLNYEPVFFAYRQVHKLDELVSHITTATPEYDFVSDDGIGHQFWIVDNDNDIRIITEEFAKLKNTYVADGHHRTAAAALVGKELRDKNPNHTGKEEYNFFLAVHFPDNQLKIMDYNRVIKDLNGLSANQLIDKLKENFTVEEKGIAEYRPAALHEFSMYLEGKWYKLTAKTGTYKDSDPIGVLDVTILSEKVLAPLFNIVDLRKDKRIDFVGGLRGLGELKRRVDSGEKKVAFALYPVTMKQLMDIADNDLIMPPKVTWFEPKLRSGLVLHALN